MNFTQRNWLRQYPFRGDMGRWDTELNQVPSDLLVGVRITCKVEDLDVFISKIYTNSGIISVLFSGTVGDIGFANGSVTSDNQAINIVSYTGGIIGNVVIGNSARTQNKTTFIFNSNNGLIEPSTVLIITPPAVSSVAVKNVKYVGDVNLTSNSITLGTGNIITTTVKDSSKIASRGDKQAKFLTCDNNIISGINTVAPNSEGNIDVYAIAPLQISSITESGITSIRITSEDATIPKLCKIANLPPEPPDLDNPDTPTVPLVDAVDPEFVSWPNY